NSQTLPMAGAAGNVQIRGRLLDIGSGALLSARTMGSGRGGNIFINANSLRFHDGAGMNATSSGEGLAGDLRFAVRALDLDNSSIQTRSDRTSGGNIIVHATDRVSLFRSGIVTSAQGSGGNITIDPLAVALN